MNLHEILDNNAGEIDRHRIARAYALNRVRDFLGQFTR